MAAPEHPPPQGAKAHELSRLLDTHESLASTYAARGEWRRAYEHLRSALDLARSDTARPTIPEQYRHEVEQLRKERAQARHESMTDPLTGTYNRRYLDARLAELQAPSVALVDLDLFKSVNDRFGHLVGDDVLRTVAELLRQSLPVGGCCARYGGEEFALVLPTSSVEAAVGVTERARSRVAAYPWHRLHVGLTVTISVGVAVPSGRPGSPHDRLLEADSLLYEAKRAGRNIVAYRERDAVRIRRTVAADSTPA